MCQGARLLCRMSGAGSVGDFDQSSCLNLVDVTVDRYAIRHQGMFPDTGDIVGYALCEIANRQPVNVLSFRRTRTLPHIFPLSILKLRCLEAARKKVSDDFAGEE